MSTPALTARALFAVALLAACSSAEDAKVPPPPPLPVAPAPVAPVAPEPSAAATPEPSGAAVDERAPAAPVAPAAKDDDEVEKPARGAVKPGASLYDLEKAGQAKIPKPAPVQPSKPTKPAPGVVTKPEPTPPAPGGITMPTPKPAAPKTGKVNVPSTAHVKVDVPKGLQAALDADTRMQSFVNQVVQIADGCYASERRKNPSVEGVLEVRVTLHSEARPDAQPKVPAALNGVLVCGMGRLMNVKMPFFTGPEGAKHTLKIHFTK